MDVAEQQAFDYVVVGSGAGGGPLACNLAKAGFKVLVLEAGGDGGAENLNYQVPAFHGDATEDPSMSWEFFVRHYTSDEQQKRDSKFEKVQDGIFYPRSGTLGGCTAHNAQITIYPHDSDWQRIAQITGDSTWKPDRMRTYFERLERCEYVNPPAPGGDNPSRHGFKGWLPTNEASPSLVLEDKELEDIVAAAAWAAFQARLETVFEIWKEVLRAGWELLKKGQNPFQAVLRHVDPNDWVEEHLHPEGLARIPLHIGNGSRFAVRDHLLATQAECAGNLEIRLNCLVSRVLFEGDGASLKAVGVEYLAGERLYEATPTPSQDPKPPVVTVRARREVILSGGAFNTPQILMLSGVGPREQLEGLGIKVLVDSPGVGKNLQDRYEVGVIGDVKPFSLLQGCTFEEPESGSPPDPALELWRTKKQGIYATNGALLAIRMRSKKDRPDPDLFIFALPAHFKGYFMGYSTVLEKNPHCITWAVLKAHTNNQGGEVRLRSTSPRERPLINFHYFYEGTEGWQEDLDSVVAGVRFVERITQRTKNIRNLFTLKREGFDKLETKLATDEEIRTFIKDEAWGHHASCTCPIGASDDPHAVLDSDFRVRGVQNLRVVDASVFPRIPGFFIVSAIYMISEKASDVILASAKEAGDLDVPSVA